jgi:serine/threonine protein kinase
MAVRDQSQKNQNSSSDGYFGTQLPAAFNDSGDDTANAGDQSTAAQQGGDDSAAASTEGQESAPAGGFGTIAAPPMEMAARAAADHAAAAAVQQPVVPRSLTRTYRSNGQNLGALQDAIRTKRASPGGAKGKVIAEVRDLHSDSKMPPGRKSTWNLQIHPRRVVGQLSSLIADLPEADVPASEAVDAVTRKEDAAAEIEVLKRIGQGAMGEIYEAVQTSLNRNLVIKTLKSDAVRTEYEQAMFVSEAVVTANLAHPNIVPIHDLGQTHDGRLFYSMKHVTGSPWSETLRALTVEENLDIFNKVCDAVAYAHSRGVVNRDLKPENVMIGEFGEVIVLDWGIAITTDEFEKKRSVLIDYQGGAGTPVYMAPEMVSADIEEIGTHSDIYLLGAVLYEALEGQPPHLVKAVWDQPPELQPSVVYRAVAQNEIEPPVKHKGELMRIALKAMSTDPADRFSSVERMQDAIREYRITGRAEERMRSCEVNKPQEYDDYQAAVALFTEALQNWPNNRRALEGNERSRIQYATLALKKQDYDLGLQIVADHEISAFKPLRKKLRKARMARRIMRWSFSSLVVLCCASFIYLFIVKSEASQAISAREIAQADTQTALAQREEAEQQKESLEKEKLLLEEEKKRTEASLKLEIARAEQAVLEKQSQLDDQESKLATATSDLEQKASELQEARENLVAAQNQQQAAKAALEATSGELQLAEEKLREAEKNAYVVEYRGVLDQIQVGRQSGPLRGRRSRRPDGAAGLRG